MSAHAKPAARLLRLAHLRRLREAEQVAAVCYRVGGAGIEFLLVKTRAGRWTFPKGSVEPGLTHAQAAALEAFEEAGVHGRMAEVSFASYTREREGQDLVIHAHLCEVLRLVPPQEAKRNRTWFSAGQAKRRLQQDRPPQDRTALARVVDRAVAQIQQSQNERRATPGRPALPSDGPQKDGLQKVHLEADLIAGTSDRIEALFTRYIRIQRQAPGRTIARIPQLGAGTGVQKVTAINQAQSDTDGTRNGPNQQ
jgi:8-oxo-dGTP pyrophosphatase MutT (NUDIX family)